MNDDVTITETFLQRLRSTTAHSHQALEDLPISKKIISPSVTEGDYALYLQRMHDVVSDAEDNIFPLLANTIPDLEERQKTSFLTADLKKLGKDSASVVKPLTDNTAYNNTTAFALGIMYVVEGSTLGGRVIYKNINSAFGFTEENGARYFAGYGGHTGSRWKAFLEYFTNYTGTHNCEDEVIAGANFAFDAIKYHLS